MGGGEAVSFRARMTKKGQSSFLGLLGDNNVVKYLKRVK